ncbi:MAG: RagB/SusD family nutrient uptake outer membrane protein [Bacteroidales bacterium]|nr:RagB/SusD family nutrient uptake outer membrane protein [Bacteroidales bacterium]
MKRYIKSLLAFVAIAVLANSCKGFLDETDQSKFLPRTADHYSSALLGEFNYKYAPNSYIQFMTDDLQDANTVTQNNSTREIYQPYFCWQKDVEMNMTSYVRTDQSSYWAYCYKVIALCNNLLENIDGVSESTVAEINYVKAEAYFIRAFLYFNLVNLYGEPYENADQAKDALGVPWKGSTGTDTYYNRESLATVYDHILSDIENSLSHLAASGLKYDNVYKISEEAVTIFLSRVHLFMKNYDKVITTLDPIMKKAKLFDYSGIASTQTYEPGNGETIYCYGANTSNNVYSACTNAYFEADWGLFESYQEDDQRREKWFTWGVNSDKEITYIRPYKHVYSNMGQCFIRYSEAYLNRAEAFAFKNSITVAKADVGTVISNRVLSKMENVTLPDTQDELIKYIYDERHREFCYEDYYRWFDLRRMGEKYRPEIKRTFKVYNSMAYIRTDTYYLRKNDPNYTLALPYKEKENNPMIMDYDRFDKVPE